MTEITVSLNGKSRQFTSGINLCQVLDELGLDSSKVAIEHNRIIAPKSQYGSIIVQQDDQLEIVQFVGGG